MNWDGAFLDLRKSSAVSDVQFLVDDPDVSEAQSEDLGELDDSTLGDMVVTLHDGTVWDYPYTELSVYRAWEDAGFSGTFYNENVRGS